MPATATAKARRNRMPSSLMSTQFYSDQQIGVFTSTAEDATQLKTVGELNAWLAARPVADRGGLDIRGRVIAELGVFKDRRGEFDQQSLTAIAELGNKAPKGLKSNFKHPTMSDDGLGKLLGRDTQFRVDDGIDAKPKVRSGHFEISSIAMKPPPEGGGTPYGEYICELAISDPSALSSSLVLNYKPEYRYDAEGNRQLEPDGKPKPAIWRPTRLWAIDCVSVGDAVDDFLSMDDLSDNDQIVRQANLLITQFFDMDEITAEALESRLNGFTKKLVAFHFSDQLEPDRPDPKDQNDMSTNPPAGKNDAGNESPTADNKQLLEAQNKTNSLLEKMIENQSKLNPDVTNGQGGNAGSDGQADDPAERAKKIAALCQSQGHPELTAKFLSADPPMTVDAVKDSLLKLTADQRALDDNANGDQGALGTNGGSTDPTPIQKLESEWESDKEVLENFGHTKEGWLAERKQELGIASGAAVLCLIGAALFGFGDANMLTSLASIAVVGMAVTTNQLYGFGGKHRRARRKVAASTTIYDGTLTFINSSGYLVGIIASGANKFGGLALMDADNSAGANGAIEIETVDEGKIRLDAVTHSLTQADIGKSIYASDNYTITTTSTSNTLIGRLSDITDLGAPIIYVD